MSQQQALTLQRWIEDEGLPYTPCPCGSTELVASTKFYGAIASTAGGDMSLGDQIESMPMAAVVCTECARVQFLNLKIIGIET